MMTPGKWDHLHSLSSPDRGLGDTTKHLKGSHCPIGCILCVDIVMTKNKNVWFCFYIYIIICIGLEPSIKCKKKPVLL